MNINRDDLKSLQSAYRTVLTEEHDETATIASDKPTPTQASKPEWSYAKIVEFLDTNRRTLHYITATMRIITKNKLSIDEQAQYLQRIWEQLVGTGPHDVATWKDIILHDREEDVRF